MGNLNHHDVLFCCIRELNTSYIYYSHYLYIVLQQWQVCACTGKLILRTRKQYKTHTIMDYSFRNEYSVQYYIAQVIVDVAYIVK